MPASLFSPRAIFLAGALFLWILAAVVESRATRLPRRGRLPDFVTIALLAAGLGLALVSQRDAIGPWLSAYAANLLIVCAVSLFYLGMERLHGEHGSLLIASLPPATIALLFPIIGLSDAVLAERVVVHATTAFAANAIVVGAAVHVMAPGRRLGPAMVVVAALAVMAAQAFRGLSMIEQVKTNPFASELPQVATSLVSVAGLLLAVAGYFVMQGTRLRALHAAD